MAATPRRQAACQRAGLRQRELHDVRVGGAHLALLTLVVLYLVVRYGNRYRRVFADYFTLNYAWLVAFVGIWMSVQHPGTDLEHGGVGRQHVTE